MPFALRVLNILRGREFIRILHLSAVEAFVDQADFPASVLIHPTMLSSFSRLLAILKFEVQPLMNTEQAKEIIVHTKMTPAASKAVKREAVYTLVYPQP